MFQIGLIIGLCEKQFQSQNCAIIGEIGKNATETLYIPINSITVASILKVEKAALIQSKKVSCKKEKNQTSYHLENKTNQTNSIIGKVINQLIKFNDTS